MTNEKNFTWAVIPFALVVTILLILLAGALIMIGAWAINLFWVAFPALGYWQSVAVAIAIWAIKTVFRLL